MVSTYFAVLLIISILIVIYMAQKNYENIDMHYWTIVILVPLILLGYWLKTRVTTPSAAMITLCYIYLDSTVLLSVILCALLYFMRINVKAWVKLLIYGTAFAHMFVIWACINNQLYYKSITLIDTGVGIATKMEGGPLKAIHWIYIVVIILSILTVNALAWIRRGTYSRRTLVVYTVLLTAGITLYIVESLADVNFSTLPTLYVIADLMIAYNYDHDHTHDITSLISKQQERHSGRAYIAIDLTGHFLSCNKKAYDFLPELEMQIVDTKLKEGQEAANVLYSLQKDFVDNGTLHHRFRVGDKVCQCEISEFSLRKNGKAQGYIFDVRDITEEQHVIKVMKDYNDALNEEVNSQMKTMMNIQEKIVLGLAGMVDSRETHSGGRVKRTTDVMRILLKEMQRQEVYEITPQLRDDIMRAAPMYDLGKITIDSGILSRQGNLTEEEQKIYESHAIKSGEFVNIVLNDVEKPRFVQVAYHMARNHHERWDGRGYPDHLVGELIPLESRLMALVDSYDEWIVEKAVNGRLEEAFLEVANLIEEGMGNRFDPNLEAVFFGAREKIENYYRGI